MASLYGKIAAEMRELITSGRLTPGDFMPTEAQLADQYSVSRNTIKTATAKLVNEGLVERVPGAHGGMRVREKIVLTHYAARAELPDSPASESDTFFREVREQGFEPTQTLSVRIEASTAELAQRLEVEEGTPVALRRCVRHTNGRPTSIQSTYYPQWLITEVPELLLPHDIPNGTTQFLRGKGFEQVALIDEYASRMAEPEEALDLQLRGGVSVLEHIRAGYTRDQAIRVSVNVLAGDANRIVVTLGEAEALKRVLDSET